MNCFIWLVKCNWLYKIIDKRITWSCIKYTSPWAGIKLTTLEVIGTDYICIGTYHTITDAKTPHPQLLFVWRICTIIEWVLFCVNSSSEKKHCEIYNFEIYMQNTNGKMDLDSGQESVVDYYETQNEQFFGYIMARTSYIFMRWWCSLSPRLTRWFGFV